MLADTRHALDSLEIQYEFLLRAVYGVLWRGRWMILVASILSIVLGFGYTERRGTIWTAPSRLYVERTGGPLTADSLVCLGDIRNYANTQAQRLRSTSVLNEALVRPELCPGQGPCGIEATDSRDLAAKSTVEVCVRVLSGAERR